MMLCTIIYQLFFERAKPKHNIRLIVDHRTDYKNVRHLPLRQLLQ